MFYLCFMFVCGGSCGLDGVFVYCCIVGIRIMIVVLSFGVCGVLFVRSKGWVLEVLVVIGYGYSAVVYLVILWVMCR